MVRWWGFQMLPVPYPSLPARMLQVCTTRSTVPQGHAWYPYCLFLPCKAPAARSFSPIPCLSSHPVTAGGRLAHAHPPGRSSAAGRRRAGRSVPIPERKNRGRIGGSNTQRRDGRRDSEPRTGRLGPRGRQLPVSCNRLLACK